MSSRRPYSTRSTNPFDDEEDDEFDIRRGGAPPSSSRSAPATMNKQYYEDDDELDDDDAEALAQTLDAMDIDQDFKCWKSFRASLSIQSSLTSSTGLPSVGSSFSSSTDESLTDAEKEDLRFWQKRIERDEVYSHHYRPVPREERELRDLATFLGVASNSSSTLTSRNSPQDKAKKPKSSPRLGLPRLRSLRKPDETMTNLMNGTPARSILLKRGPVLYKGEERELILLTHGFVLAKVGETSTENKNNNNNNKKPLSGRFRNVIQRTYEQCAMYTRVKTVKDTSTGGRSGEPTFFRFSLQLYGDDSNHNTGSTNTFEFQCATLHHQKAWLDALEHVIVQAYIHSHDAPPNTVQSTFGWQHLIIQTSLYTPAIMGDAQWLDQTLSTKQHKRNMNALDTYHEMSALHYATKANHVQCIRVLLDWAAQVNVKDGEGKTPMYYAERGHFQDTKALLEEFGATPSRMAEVEERGELFRDAAALEEEQRRKYQASRGEYQASRQAKAVQSQMSHNMAAMQERGQRLEGIDSKTKTLQADAANYASMARQLKDKTKKQSKWGF